MDPFLKGVTLNRRFFKSSPLTPFEKKYNNKEEIQQGRKLSADIVVSLLQGRQAFLG